MKQIITKYPFWSALLGTFLFYGIIFLFFTVRMGLDERHLASMVSGIFLNQNPSEFIIFSNILKGKLLQNLYLYYGSFAWYDFILLVSSLISHLTILYLLFCKYPSKALIFWIMLFGIGLYATVKIYFTVVGAYVGFAGLSLFIYECLRNHTRKSVLGIAVLLMIWSSCIRFHSFALVCVISLPFGLYLLYFNYQKIQNIIPKIVILGFTIVVILGLKSYDSYYYKSHPDWENYQEYIKYPVSILDYDHLPSGPYKKTYQKNGWSDVEYAMLKSWFYSDEKVFGLDKFKELMAEHSVYSIKFIRQRGVWLVLSVLRDTFTSSHAILAGLSIIFLLSLNFHRKYILLLGLTMGYIFLVLLYLAYFMKITHYHITYLIFSLLVLNFSLIIDNQNFKTELKYKVVSICFLLIGIFYSLNENMERSKQNEQGITGFHALTNHLKRDKLYLWWDISANYVSGGFLDNPQRIKGIDLIHLGHCSYYASIKETLNEYHITNLHEGMVNHPDIILVSKKAKNAYYQAYMKKHYNRNIEFEFIEKKHQCEFYKVIENN